MCWTKNRRPGVMLAAVATLLLAACGGGDKSPTGPGGGGLAGPYDLIALGQNGLPAVTHVEDCMATQVTSGALRLNGDGTWEMQLQFQDEDGDNGYEDSGWYADQGSTVWLDSGYSGSSYQATYDGGRLRVMYDFCYNGVPDVEFVFDK